MALEPLGLLVVFGYFTAVVLSLPAAAGVLLLARRVGVRRAADLVGLVAFGLVTVAAVVVGLAAGPVAGATLAGLGLLVLLSLWALPALVGSLLVSRLSPCGDEAALGYAVAGLPVALLASALLFLAPGGPGRYNLTFLSGPSLWLASLVFLAVVLLGPGLVGAALCRLASRRR